MGHGINHQISVLIHITLCLDLGSFGQQNANFSYRVKAYLAPQYLECSDGVSAIKKNRMMVLPEGIKI